MERTTCEPDQAADPTGHVESSGIARARWRRRGCRGRARRLNLRSAGCSTYPAARPTEPDHAARLRDPTQTGKNPVGCYRRSPAGLARSGHHRKL